MSQNVEHRTHIISNPFMAKGGTEFSSLRRWLAGATLFTQVSGSAGHRIFDHSIILMSL